MKEENERYAIHLERQSKECTYSIVSRRVAHAEPKKEFYLHRRYMEKRFAKSRQNSNNSNWETETENSRDIESECEKVHNNKIQQHAYLRLHWVHLLSGACVRKEKSKKLKNKNRVLQNNNNSSSSSSTTYIRIIFGRIFIFPIIYLCEPGTLNAIFDSQNESRRKVRSEIMWSRNMYENIFVVWAVSRRRCCCCCWLTFFFGSSYG